MMKSAKYLDPSGEMTIHKRLSRLEAYDYVHSQQSLLLMSDTFIQQMMLYRVQLGGINSKKSYARCSIKVDVSYENLQDERKLDGYPICPYGDIIFFIKSANEGASDFLSKNSEETYFYTDYLGKLPGVLRTKVKWNKGKSRWNISAKPVNPKKIQRAGIVLIVPYNSHYDTVY